MVYMESSLVFKVLLGAIICLSLSTSSLSLRVYIPSPSPIHQGATNVDPTGHDDPLRVHSVLLPRKLKPVETSSSIKGRVYKKGGEDVKEEEEEGKMSDFMGMDYARVRRRRHIHNRRRS